MRRTNAWIRTCLALMLALLPALPAAQAARATLKTRTEIRHYAVSGHDELGLLRDMRRKGPRVGGRPALASTRMRARYTARLVRRQGSCRVQRLDMAVTFTMTLPRLQPRNRVRSAARNRWPAFVERLRRHEKRHIAIWMNCLRQVRRQLPGLRASSCASLKRRMRGTYERIMARCGRRHDAFDRREKHAAASLPFIRAAFGLQRQAQRRR